VSWRTGGSILGCVLLLVSGQILIKHGLNDMGGFTFSLNGGGLLREIGKLVRSLPIWAGLVVTGLSTLLWFDLISRVDLSYAYPMLSISYVVMLFASWLLLSESPSPIRWVGVVVICLGVFLVSRS